MRLGRTFTTFLSWALVASATILENGQVRENSYPGQLEPVTLDDSWRDYPADAPEISYKGRWDSQHISCMFPIRFLFPRLLFLTLTLTLERTSGWSYVLLLSPILSRLLINPVHRASKSSSLGKRYMSIPINLKIGSTC